MKRFRKKPVVIHAIQWDGKRSTIESLEAAGLSLPPVRNLSGGAPLVVRTLEGDMRAELGDWIIKGVNGEFYPCKPDIFEKTYDAADG